MILPRKAGKLRITINNQNMVLRHHAPPLHFAGLQSILR